MNVNLLRKIDYWVGIPICFLLSSVNNTIKLFSRRRKNKIKKILFLELSEMGSVILSYPAILKAKKQYPEAELYFWIFKENKESVEILNVISDVNIITMRGKSFRSVFIDTFKNLRQIRKLNLDVIIDMEGFSRFTAILSYLSKAKIRVGYHKCSMEGLYRGNLHNRRVPFNPFIHISNNFLSLVDSINTSGKKFFLSKKSVEKPNINFQYQYPATRQNSSIFNRIKKYSNLIKDDSKIILINPDSSGLLPLRRWPLEKYERLCLKFLEDKNIFIIFIGRQNKNIDKKISVFKKQENCINLIGKTTLKELIDLFRISDLLISHDSGPANFAALTKLPVIVLFGPETPLLYSPLSNKAVILYKNFACSPCVSSYNHRKSVCSNNKCVKDITVKEVLNAAKKILF
jgi:ADP-heptose:LPS heptosyltransferase